MTPEEYLQQADVAEALRELQDKIRQDPSNLKLRIFLFQLLAVTGDWKRAMTQLKVAAEMDPESALMAQVCGPAIQCEMFRADVFAGKRSPLFFGEPEDWMGWLSQVPSLLADGNVDAAAELRDKAFEAAPACPGALNEAPFEWLADADARLGPLLEVILNGHYYWIPFSRIKEIVIEAPSDLRDMVWLPAHFTWANEGQVFGLIPTRYPGSEKHEDTQVQLARKTLWEESGSEFYLGYGQRMLVAGEDDRPLLECRHIVFDQPESDTAAEPEDVNA